MFNQTKPIVWFDLETTGANYLKDRIIELSAIKIMPDGSRTEIYSRFNPIIPILDESVAIHGITNEDVRNEPKFADKAKEILEFFKGCDLGGYNINKFDLPFLMEEFMRCKLIWDVSDVKVIDTFRIWSHFEPRNLASAYKLYCGKDLENAHSAKADVEATIEIAMAQYQKHNVTDAQQANDYSLYENEVNRLDLAAKIVINNGEEIINFGKYEGRSIKDLMVIDPGYIEWAAKNENFPIQTRVAFKLLMKKYENKEKELTPSFESNSSQGWKNGNWKQ